MCLGVLPLSPPRVLSPVYLANSIETIGRYAANIPPVFSALAYFQAALYGAFSPVRAELLDDPSKHFCGSVSSSVPHFSFSINSVNLTQSAPTVVISFIFQLRPQPVNCCDEFMCNESCEIEQITHLQGPQLNSLKLSKSIVLLF